MGMHKDGEEDCASERVVDLSDPRTRGPGLSLRMQAAIGLGLRAMYDELKDQPLPDRLLDLIAKLEEKRTDDTHEG
jgi:hypothetical protein